METLIKVLNTCSIQRLYRKWLFSEKTYNILNYVTLSISDAQIREEYDVARSKNFDKMFRIIMLVAIANMLFRISQVLSNDEVPSQRIVFAFHQISIVVLWAAMRRCSKKRAPLVIFVYLFGQCLSVLLSYMQVQPEYMDNPDKKTDEVKIFLSLIYIHCVNYNTYRLTLILYALITLPFAYASLFYQVKIKYDPYTTVPLSEDREYFQSQMFLYCLILVAFTAHHYLVQRDLIIITIEKQMILRHQVQLAEFFRKSSDSVIVASENMISHDDKPTGRAPEPEVLLYNRTIKTMLKVNMSGVANEQILNSITTPIFRLIGNKVDPVQNEEVPQVLE